VDDEELLDPEFLSDLGRLMMASMSWDELLLLLKDAESDLNRAHQLISSGNYYGLSIMQRISTRLARLSDEFVFRGAASGR
jgi:hypothetical protein